MSYLEGTIKQFEYYKSLGDKAMAQITEEQLFWSPNAESNSIAVIVQHIAGNMLSRWTDFLTTDGEKEWRNREAEFDAVITNKTELLRIWEQGWNVFFNAIKPLTESDLERIVYIRNQGHTVTEAIQRQLAHYPYHIGQMVYLAKMMADSNWQSLSIPRGNSKQFNDAHFSQEKQRKHFTDDFK
ncbi:MAG: DUF1572 family protein [Flavobacteriales bacterium]